MRAIVVTLAISGLLSPIALWASGPTHPTVNTFAIGGPYGSSVWPHPSPSYLEWLNDYIDWQITGGDGYWPYYRRGQPMGVYLSAHSDYPEGALYRYLLTHLERAGLPAELAFIHWKINTYHRPSQESAPRLVPGWDIVNDANNDGIRDYEADYGWNNEESEQFTVLGASIHHPGRSWKRNQWTGAVVHLWYGSGYGQDNRMVETSCTGNGPDTLYVAKRLPDQSYRWYAVDDARAANHLAVAESEARARVSGYTWTRQHFNIADSRIRALIANYAVEQIMAIHTGYQGPASLFVDDCFVRFPPDYCGVLYGGATMEGVHETWLENFRTLLQEIQQAVRPAYLIANTAEYVSPRYDDLLAATDGALLELWIQPWRERWMFNHRLEAVRRRQRAGLYLFLHCTGWSTNMPKEREQIFALATYLLTLSDSTYYLYDTGNAYGVNLGDPDRWWHGLLSVDLGPPLGPPYEFSSGSGWVWRRDFANGCALVRPKPWQKSNMTDSSWIDLNGRFYRLDAQGGRESDSTITGLYLHNAEGAVLKRDLPRAQILLIKPNGSEHWVSGTSSTIEWVTTHSTDSVVVALSIDWGHSWRHIGSVSHQNTLSWKVLPYTTDHALFKATAWWRGGGAHSDVSDSPFAIVDIPADPGLVPSPR
jgi:hypothetical protein